MSKVLQIQEEIKKLLKDRPDLIPLQQDIDRMMKSAGSKRNRLVLINELMMDSLEQLKEKLLTLQQELAQYRDLLEKELKRKQND